MPAINNDTFNDHFFDRAFFIGQIIISEFLGRALAVAAINDDGKSFWRMKPWGVSWTMGVCGDGHKNADDHDDDEV